MGLAAAGAVLGRADDPRELAPSRADVGSLFSDARKIAGRERYEYSFAEGRIGSFENFQAVAREKVFEVLQYRPEKVDPKPELLEKVEKGDYIREKIRFSTSPQLRVPAYVLIPKNAKGRLPAIVDLHSHGGMFLFGKEKVIDMDPNHAAMTAYHERNYDGRPTATALVRRGYVVITIDAFAFGERRILMDEDLRYGWDRAKYTLEDVKHLNQKCRDKEPTITQTLAFAGTTWPGVVFWDDIRTVDYLVTRPEVDPKRIGCMGISMGGYRALFLSALDRRIRAGCVVGFMSTVRPMMQAYVDTHSMVHFVPGLHRYLDWPDVASLTAPRSLFVQQCSRDRLFPLEGMKESVKKIGQAYEKAGAGSSYIGKFYDVPHQFTKPMQDEAFAWMDRQLG
jgi:dienelactone hydrolase